MRIRSRPTLTASLACLALAGALGILLLHDGEAADTPAQVAQAAPGSSVRLKAHAEPMPEHLWHEALTVILPLVENHTYLLWQGTDATIVATHDAPLPPGPVVLDGRIAHRATLDDGTPLVLLTIHDVTEPVLFR